MENVDCKIVWEDPLPQDETALRANFEADLRMGVVDQQTVSERLGYDWDVIKARKEEQQQAQDNVGAMILRAFDRTGGMPQNAGGGTANNGFGKQKQPLAR
jgi:hypothetical protein